MYHEIHQQQSGRHQACLHRRRQPRLGLSPDTNWANTTKSMEMAKKDLFQRYGYIAAGDRHLVEFCPGKWYLKNPQRLEEMQFGLTTVPWRKEGLQKRLDRGAKLASGEEEVKIKLSGEEGVTQIRALLGLTELVTCNLADARKLFQEMLENTKEYLTMYNF